MLVTVVDEHRFRAMGTDCMVQVVGAPPTACDLAEALVRGDEARWTRFSDDSELSLVNARCGAAVEVSAETRRLARLAVELHRSTRGWFDPLVGGPVVAAGYDRTFDQIETPAKAAVPEPVRGDLVVHDRSLEVPAGCRLDFGGIAKGRTADRVVDALIDLGCDGVCADIGGDVRYAGSSPSGDGWWTSLDHRPGETIGVLSGAVATSTTRRRRWTYSDGSAGHHLIDPRTRRPSTTSLTSATVVAPTAAVAEALTKVVLLAPRVDAMRIVHDHEGVAAIATDDAGDPHRFGPIDTFLVEGAPA